MAKFELWMTATLLVFLTFCRIVQASPPEEEIEEEFEGNHYGSCVCKQSCDCPSEDVLQRITQVEESVQIHSENQTKQAVLLLARKMALLQDSVLQRITRVEESVQMHSESQTEQAVVLERKMALLQESVLQRITRVEESVQIHSESQTEQAVALERKMALLHESVLQSFTHLQESVQRADTILERKMALLQESVLQNAQVITESQAERIEILGRKLDGLQERPPSWLCPEEFTYNSESRICIKLYRNRVRWAAAKYICHNIGRGYRLAVVDTSEKLQFIQAFLSATNLQRRSWYDQCWVGGHQEYDEGRWLWSTGAGVIRGWGPGQPNDGGGNNEDCLTLAWGTDWTTWMINDNVCNEIKPYICEYQFN